MDLTLARLEDRLTVSSGKLPSNSCFLSGIVAKLLTTVTDDSEKAREAMVNSLVEIGSKQPMLVVSAIVTFLTTQKVASFSCTHTIWT